MIVIAQKWMKESEGSARVERIKPVSCSNATQRACLSVLDIHYESK